MTKKARPYWTKILEKTVNVFLFFDDKIFGIFWNILLGGCLNERKY